MRKTIIKTACLLAPGLLTRFAYRQLTRPAQYTLRADALKLLETAVRERVTFQGFQIQTYIWRGSGKKVLLIHGWEGQTGNFSEIIQRLVEAGYTVCAFDGPAHGFSSRGKTSMFEFADLAGVMFEKFKPDYAISHSFGGVAATAALSRRSDLGLEKFILLTTPDRFSERIDFVAAQNGITEGVKQRLIRRIGKESGIDPATMNVSNYVQQVRVDQALILHDKSDKVISIQQSQNVQRNWPNCVLIEIENTGHFKILRAAPVIDQILAFFK